MYKDPFTGLYHTHYRDYDPIHNRWLSEDPAGYQDGLNLYAAYMGMDGRDPLGLETGYWERFGDGALYLKEKAGSALAIGQVVSSMFISSTKHKVTSKINTAKEVATTTSEYVSAIDDVTLDDIEESFTSGQVSDSLTGFYVQLYMMDERIPKYGHYDDYNNAKYVAVGTQQGAMWAIAKKGGNINMPMPKGWHAPMLPVHGPMPAMAGTTTASMSTKPFGMIGGNKGTGDFKGRNKGEEQRRNKGTGGFKGEI